MGARPPHPSTAPRDRADRVSRAVQRHRLPRLVARGRLNLARRFGLARHRVLGLCVAEPGARAVGQANVPLAPMTALVLVDDAADGNEPVVFVSSLGAELDADIDAGTSPTVPTSRDRDRAARAPSRMPGSSSARRPDQRNAIAAPQFGQSAVRSLTEEERDALRSCVRRAARPLRPRRHVAVTEPRRPNHRADGSRRR